MLPREDGVRALSDDRARRTQLEKRGSCGETSLGVAKVGEVRGSGRGPSYEARRKLIDDKIRENRRGLSLVWKGNR
jgi:hypothetical protein